MKSEVFYEKTPYSEILAPYTSISLKDPLSEKRSDLMALIDTGYDGNLMVPYEIFKELNLFKYQFPEDMEAIGELVTGDKIRIMSAEALITLENTEVDFIVLVDTFEECHEVVLGREMVNMFLMTLNGPKRKGSLKYIELG